MHNGPAVMVIVLMGPAGVGKTTVGRALAEALGWRVADADDLHASEDVAQMRRGTPLTEAQRQPWLWRVHASMAEADARGESLVVACSALRDSYRKVLAAGIDALVFVFLDADAAVLHDRLARRTGHFAGERLVESQLAALERPDPGEALIVDATQPVPAQVAAIRAALRF
jgi:gluconokinase